MFTFFGCSCVSSRHSDSCVLCERFLLLQLSELVKLCAQLLQPGCYVVLIHIDKLYHLSMYNSVAKHGSCQLVKLAGARSGCIR